jgi:hypothetical protein
MSTSRRATTFIMASSPGRWCGGPPIRSCYHRACDTTENIDREVLEQNTRALVRVLRAVAIAAPTAAATAATAISGMILIVDVKVASASRSVGLGASGRVRLHSKRRTAQAIRPGRGTTASAIFTA